MNEAYAFRWGADKAVYRAAELGGWVLLLGVTHRSNSTVHLVEERADVEYLRVRKSNSRMRLDEFLALDAAGQRAALETHCTGPQRDFSLITPYLERAGVERAATAGNARIRLARGMDIITGGLEAIRSEPGLLQK